MSEMHAVATAVADVVAQVRERLIERGIDPEAVCSASSTYTPQQRVYGDAASSCRSCCGVGFTRSTAEPGDPLFGRPIPCPSCAGQRTRARLQRFLGNTSLRERHASKTFRSFVPRADQRVAYERALRYSQDPHGIFLLMGSVARGKTHIAAAIAWMWTAMSAGQPLPLFYTAQDLLERVQQAQRDDQAAERGDDRDDAPRLEAVVASLRMAPLLVLDDLGAQHVTAYRQARLFEILDYRYDAGLPTVISTNLTPDQLAQAPGHGNQRLASRLLDTDSTWAVVLVGTDLRRHREAIPTAIEAPLLTPDADATDFHLYESEECVCPCCHASPHWGALSGEEPSCPRLVPADSVAPPEEWLAIASGCPECGHPIGQSHDSECSQTGLVL